MLYNSILLALWIVLMGDISTHSMIVGLTVVGIIRLVLYKMNTRLSFPFNYKIILYIPWLLKEIIMSTISVVKIIWNPFIHIRPGFDNIRTKLKSGKAKVLYANSVTLTPGTCTISLGEDGLLVHSLVKQDKWSKEMENKIESLL